jgi:hypothetical protein
MLKWNSEQSKVFSSDQVEQTIANAWNDLNFDDVQGVLQNWTNRLAWVIDN